MADEDFYERRHIIRHSDTLKERRANGRLFQILGAIAFVAFFFSFFAAPFIDDYSIIHALIGMGISLAAFIIGRAMEWIYKE